MKNTKNIILFLVVFQLIVGFTYTEVKAEKARLWSPDARVPGYFDDTFTPFLVVDSAQIVHALTSQWINDGQRRLAIVHREWSLSGGWTKPVDVILAPTRDARFLSAFLDSSDLLHIIYFTKENDTPAIYYSSAPAANADIAIAWSVPELVGIAPSLEAAAIIGDDDDNLFIIYSGTRDGSGVYFARYMPEVNDWSVPSPIFLTYDSSLFPFSLRLAMGPDRIVRATWSVVNSFGYDQGLYFANYSIPDAQWSNPLELDFRVDDDTYFGPSYPAMVDNGDEIVIMYNNGNPFPGRFVDLGRPVQLVRSSNDGGETWNGPIGPFPYHQGRSGESTMVLDSSGVPHALFIQRIEGQAENGEYLNVGGIWHSALQNGVWKSPERIVTTYAPHDIRAVVSQGNVLLAVWREDPGAKQQHGVWFSYTILDSPEIPVMSPTPLSGSPAPISTPTQMLVSIPATETPVVNMDGIKSGLASSPAGPIIISIVPVILILIGVVVIHQLYHNQNK